MLPAKPQRSPTLSFPALIPLPKAPALLGLSRSSIYRAVQQGQLSMKKVGRSSFITAASALVFLDGLPDAKLVGDGKGDRS